MENDSTISLKYLDALEPVDIVTLAESKGKAYKQIKTHQIRSFYSEINAMKLRFADRNRGETEADRKANKASVEEDLVKRMHLLKPRLAYRAGGRGGQHGGIKDFYTFISEVIAGVQNGHDKSKGLENFFILIESIVAYHKYYGGE